MKFWFVLLFLKLNMLFASDFEQALSYAKEKNWLLASSYFEKHLRQNPTDDQALYNLGICLLHQDKQVEALYFLEKAYKFNPNLQECKAPITTCRQQLGLTGEWTEPFSPIRLKLMEISLNQWSFIVLFLSIFSAVIVVFYLRKKTVTLRYLLLPVLLLFILSIYVTSQKSRSLSITHGIVTTKTLKTFADEKGTALIDISLFPGERVSVFEVGERVGLELENGIRTWISSQQIRLF